MYTSNMNITNLCSCKGIRTCLACEASKPINDIVYAPSLEYFYCKDCKKGYLRDDSHPHHAGKAIDFPGITIIEDFVTEDEEKHIISNINESSWVESQSGRRKQDYGPKVNFKKRKLRTAGFNGLPDFSKKLVDKIHEVPSLQDFLPVEMCNLEYSPLRGSAIDPHFDDFWLWGERLITINLMSSTFLSMTKDSLHDVIVEVPMKKRSLLVVHGAARYEWKHAVQRKHITADRIAITFRELTPEFMPGGDNETKGKEILDIALTFCGSAVGSDLRTVKEGER